MRITPARGVAFFAALLAAAACSADRLTVPNYNNPTPDAIQSDAAAAVPLLVSGILRGDRANATGYVSGVGILGRESYNYAATEPRNTTGWLTSDVNNSTSFAGVSNWAPFYTDLRNIANLLTIAEGASDAVLTAAQKNGVRGFAHTMEALNLYYVISTRDDFGAVVTLDVDPTVITPIVGRDSVYRYIAARLDLAKTELAAAGTSFPFTLHAGFAGFTTPATFLRFNRALAARVNAYRASAGVGGCAARSTTCYQEVLTNLSESFLDPAGSLTAGPFRPYSAASGETANGISNEASVNFLLHYKSDSGVATKASGARDDRYTAKVLTLSAPRGPANASQGVNTRFDYAGYATRTSPVPIIRNEELILLRAEARYFTGNAGGALEDVNTVRTRSGGLAALPSGFATADAFVDELLYNRRWSLLFEGHRWIDHRRFGRLNALPRDLASHVIVSRLPIPQAECLSRRTAGATFFPAQGCVGV